jgi:hypothetical protein
MSEINRTKALILVLFVVYWAAIVAILVAARNVYDQILALQIGELPSNYQWPAEISVLVVLTSLLLLLSAGVIRGWRWTFWLILVVFLAGVLHVVTGALQLAAVLPANGPTWYVLFQTVIGLIQFVIAVGMLVGYHKRGIWGAF